MTFGTDVKSNINENIRSSLEENTGVVGQALKARREKMNRDKEVAAELSKIAPKTARLTSDNKAFKKIEVATTQISENLQLINKWAGAQATTHEETTTAMAEQKKASQAALETDLRVDIPDPNEDGSIFDSILDLFGDLGKKIKVKVPKGKGGILKKIAQFGARNIGTIAKVGVGVAALTYSGGLNTNEQEELDKRRNLPPEITPTKQPVDYSVPPPTGAVEENTKKAAAAPDIEAAKQAATQPAPIPIVPAPAPPPPPPPAPAPTPVAAPIAAAGEPKKTLNVTKVAPATKPPEVAASYAPPNASSASSSVPALSSIVKVKSDASINGINSELAKRVATMAVAFKKETGKTLQINSGIRTNEEQKQLWDAKVRELGGNEKEARSVVAEPMAPLGNGQGSLHFKERGGLALDIEPNYPDGLNKLAGTQKEPTGWLEKFGLIRPVQKYNKRKQRWEEDWHVQLSSTPPIGDDGIVAGKGGVPVDLDSGKSLPIPTDPNTGKSLVDSSKTVAQLKQEQSQPGQTVVVVKNTTNITDYDKKKQPQGQTVAAVGG